MTTLLVLRDHKSAIEIVFVRTCKHDRRIQIVCAQGQYRPAESPSTTCYD